MKSGTSPSCSELTISRPAGVQRIDDLTLGDEAFLAGVLRHPRHQMRPIRVAGVVIPDQDRAAGPTHAHHLDQCLADVGWIGNVVERGYRQRDVEALALERQCRSGCLHRGDLRVPRTEHVEHPRRRVDAGDLVPCRLQASSEHAGPAADIEDGATGAMGLHERRPLAEVVLDNVRGERLVVLRRDLVKVRRAHGSAPALGRGRVEG